MTEKLSEKLALVATVDSQLADNASVTSDWVNMANFNRVMFVVNVGASDTTLDAKIQSSDDAAGTNAADVTGRAITQLSGTDDNKQVILEIREDELNGNDTHVALVVTAGDGATGVQVSAIGLGGCPNYHPASDYNLNSVVQVVS